MDAQGHERTKSEPMKEHPEPDNKATTWDEGSHVGSLSGLLPPSWIPFTQLSRVIPPVALNIIYFPHLVGLLYAARILALPPTEVLRSSLVMLCVSFFYSNAGHAWNDLIDAPIDAQIERTRKRPIPRGAITRRAAAIFAATQILGAFLFLLLLPRGACLAEIPNVVATAYYPFAKRQINLPQLVLGFCLAWGVIVGSAGAGLSRPWADGSVVGLLLASVTWVLIFDTLYAHIDLKDDLRVGVKSAAVQIRGFAKPALWLWSLAMASCLIASGSRAGMGPAYYIVTVLGAMLGVGFSIAKVDLSDRASCWNTFSHGFLFTGVIMVAGLAVEYWIG